MAEPPIRDPALLNPLACLEAIGAPCFPKPCSSSRPAAANSPCSSVPPSLCHSPIKYHPYSSTAALSRQCPEGTRLSKAVLLRARKRQRRAMRRALAPQKCLTKHLPTRLALQNSTETPLTSAQDKTTELISSLGCTPKLQCSLDRERSRAARKAATAPALAPAAPGSPTNYALRRKRVLQLQPCPITKPYLVIMQQGPCASEGYQTLL